MEDTNNAASALMPTSEALQVIKHVQPYKSIFGGHQDPSKSMEPAKDMIQTATTPPKEVSKVVEQQDPKPDLTVGTNTCTSLDVVTRAWVAVQLRELAYEQSLDEQMRNLYHKGYFEAMDFERVRKWGWEEKRKVILAPMDTKGFYFVQAQSEEAFNVPAGTPHGTKFTCFPKLPVVVQLMIWEQAREPRLVELRFNKGKRGRRQIVDKKLSKWYNYDEFPHYWSPTPIPAAHHVCKQSRHEAQKHCKLSFPYYRPGTMDEPRIFFDSAKDTLALTCHPGFMKILNIIGCNELTTGMWKSNKIQSLAICAKARDYFNGEGLHLCIRNSRIFRKLRCLFILEKHHRCVGDKSRNMKESEYRLIKATPQRTLRNGTNRFIEDSYKFKVFAATVLMDRGTVTDEILEEQEEDVKEKKEERLYPAEYI